MFRLPRHPQRRKKAMPNNTGDPDTSDEKDDGAPGNGQPKADRSGDNKVKFNVGDTQATNSQQYIAEKMEFTGLGVNEVQQLFQNTLETVMSALGGYGGRSGSRRRAFSDLTDNPDLPFHKYGEAHNSPTFVSKGAETGEKSDDIKLPETVEE